MGRLHHRDIPWQGGVICGRTNQIQRIVDMDNLYFSLFDDTSDVHVCTRIKYRSDWQAQFPEKWHLIQFGIIPAVKDYLVPIILQ